MLLWLKQCSISTKIWVLLWLSTVFFLASSIYFQHYLNLEPCVLCIYERTTVIALFIVTLLLVFSARIGLIRVVLLLALIIISIKGLSLSVEHINFQQNPMPWQQCPIAVEFPKFMPLDQYIPSLFKATGDCSEITWSLWGFSMPQFLKAIFIGYLVVFTLFLISQLKRIKQGSRRIFR